MTLLELCEPLLLYICFLGRLSRAGEKGKLELSQVRANIEDHLKNMRSQASTDGHLSEQYDKIELVLIFFIDFMIKESSLSFAKDWNELAFDKNELAGDERFFDLLDATLEDKGPAASERLAIFYTCMGVGFTGVEKPEYIRKKMLQCSARIRDMMDADEWSVICPESYEHVDTRDLVEPPGKKLLGIAIALIGLCMVSFITNICLFKWASDEVNGALVDIGNRPQAVAEQQEEEDMR
jgi:type VI secretion system protein ImpK